MIFHAIFIVLSHFFYPNIRGFCAENFIEKTNEKLWDEKIKNSMSEWKVNVRKLLLCPQFLRMWMPVILANAVCFLNWSEIFSKIFCWFLFLISFVKLLTQQVDCVDEELTVEMEIKIHSMALGVIIMPSYANNINK